MIAIASFTNDNEENIDIPNNITKKIHGDGMRSVEILNWN